MISLKGEIELGGERWVVRAPARAIDVLHADIFLVAKAQESGSMVGPLELESIQAWCARHVVTPVNSRELIDSLLSVRELQLLREKIVEVASLPGRVIDQVKEFYFIARSGGCECPSCMGRVEQTASNRKRYDCMYAEMQGDIDRIIEATYSLGQSPAFDAPWWLYQLQQAQARGIAKAVSEERKKNSKINGTHQKLKSRGMLR